MPCYAYLVFGTAKDVSIGPTAVMSLLTSEFAASPIEGDPTYAIVLAMMCGIIQFAMGVLHLGNPPSLLTNDPIMNTDVEVGLLFINYLSYLLNDPIRLEGDERFTHCIGIERHGVVLIDPKRNCHLRFRFE